jgi:hypothetical protein
VFTRWGPRLWSWAVFARGDPGRGYWDILFEPDGGLKQILCEQAWRAWLAAWPVTGEGVGCLVVSPEDMVELEGVKFLLQHPNLLPICSHAGVMIVRLPHVLNDDELRVLDVKPLNLKFSDNAHTID